MIRNRITGKVFWVAVVFILHLSPLTSLQAQWGDYGIKASIGSATITDDLSTKSPILGGGIGGYLNFTFSKSKTVLGEIFYLQTGLNINRRGSNYQVILDNKTTISIREGFYHAYYAQIPFLACFHMELPIRRAGHVVGVCVGPAVSIGIAGRCHDRMVAPFLPSYAVNYDTDITGTASDRAVFNHLARFDVSAIIGLTYEYKNIALSLYVDHGFIATSKEDDILRIIENSQGASSDIKIEIPNGNNSAFMLGIAYRLGSFED